MVPFFVLIVSLLVFRGLGALGLDARDARSFGREAVHPRTAVLRIKSTLL